MTSDQKVKGSIPFKRKTIIVSMTNLFGFEIERRKKLLRVLVNLAGVEKSTAKRLCNSLGLSYHIEWKYLTSRQRSNIKMFLVNLRLQSFVKKGKYVSRKRYFGVFLKQQEKKQKEFMLKLNIKFYLG